jgi:NAD(P)-dependent dehydrogenase (short-subunit alcohol dehydrogenase family)
MKIENKTILVTGANRGIGKSVVETLVAHGAGKVYAAVRSLASAEPLVEAFGEKVVPILIDLGDPETIKAAAAVAQDVEILVNNAGVLKITSILDEQAIEAFRHELEINVLGLLRVAQAFAPILKANGGGALVQLNSVASIKNFAALATYSASKAASYSITQGLRDSLRDQGTAVVSVHPGPIATDMGNEAGFSEIAEPPGLVAEAIVNALENEEFHVFPDTMAKQFGGAYESFANEVIEAQLQEQ